MLPSIDRITIIISNIFHGILKNLQFRAISFIIHSVVNIVIKTWFINESIRTVSSDCSLLSAHIANMFKNMQIIIKMSNF